MSRRLALLIVLLGCCVLLGGEMIQSAAPAVASSTATSRTAPRDLTKHFPLGPQHLCCQSASRSVTSAAPRSIGAAPGASAGGSAGRSSGSAHHASSGVTVIAFWLILGAVMTGLLVVGAADLRRAHRESSPLPPGITTANYLERARAAADLVSRAHPGRPTAESPPVGAGQERRRRERPRTGEELAYRRADPVDRSRMAFNLGVALHERGDFTGAMAAYRRAERQGDPDASFNLGVLLCEAGDLDGAEGSWRRSAQRGTTRAEDLEFLVRRRRERQTAGAEHEGPDR